MGESVVPFLRYDARASE